MQRDIQRLANFSKAYKSFLENAERIDKQYAKIISNAGYDYRNETGLISGGLSYKAQGLPRKIINKFKEGKVDADINIDTKGIGKADNSTLKSGINQREPYSGVKQASDYLKSQGVPRDIRK